MVSYSTTWPKLVQGTGYHKSQNKILGQPTRILNMTMDSCTRSSSHPTYSRGYAHFRSLHPTLAAGTGKPLVFTPYRVSECPVTHNIAVADLDSKLHGGEGKPRVVVMDTNFKKLFVYHGKDTHTNKQTSQSGGQQFNPWGAVYDSVGNLIIGDGDNNRILLISGRGEFLMTTYKDDYSTEAVGVDMEDVLWAVFGYNNVKLLQYSSM